MVDWPFIEAFSHRLEVDLATDTLCFWVFPYAEPTPLGKVPPSSWRGVQYGTDAFKDCTFAVLYSAPQAAAERAVVRRLDVCPECATRGGPSKCGRMWVHLYRGGQRLCHKGA